jgi:hypothetical protein
VCRSKDDNHVPGVNILELMNASKKTGILVNARHFEDFELKISKKKKYLRRSRAKTQRGIVVTFEEFKAGRQSWRCR